MQTLSVELPNFVVGPEVSEIFGDLLKKSPSNEFGQVDFDWSDVLFFDDYTLLKLVLLERYLRRLGKRVRNIGFSDVGKKPNIRVILRQLWALGWPELIASSHLSQKLHLKESLHDDAELLEGDPLQGYGQARFEPLVVPTLCCHDWKYFASASREEKLLDAFIKACLHPTATSAKTWDLVETRDFRHLLLQQYRRNVVEHSGCLENDAIGLAIARVWTQDSFSSEWSLAKATERDLARMWRDSPVIPLLRGLGGERGVLQISVIDDGAGIPSTLKTVHDGMLIPKQQDGLFALDTKCHYKDASFERRFAEPAGWSDTKARLIAFSMDAAGTSKPDRPQEVKGLQYLRERVVLAGGGRFFLKAMAWLSAALPESMNMVGLFNARFPGVRRVVSVSVSPLR